MKLNVRGKIAIALLVGSIIGGSVVGVVDHQQDVRAMYAPSNITWVEVRAYEGDTLSGLIADYNTGDVDVDKLVYKAEHNDTNIDTHGYYQGTFVLKAGYTVLVPVINQ